MPTRVSSKHAKPPPPQEQEMPGSQKEMDPKPMDEDPGYRAGGKLEGRVAVITGADSGIGRAVALLFAKEGADVCIVYLCEHDDAKHTARRVEELGRRAITIPGDIGEPEFCRDVAAQTVHAFGRIDILVNNAAEQHEIKGLQDLKPDDVERTFQTNIFGFFYMTQAVLPHLKEGSSIINTTSVQALDPSPGLMDYACTKASILNFTRSLAKELAKRKIRVNAVAPGPIWTPLIPASFSADHVARFGKDTLFGRPGQPAEVAPAYVFFASEGDSSYVTGQVLHVNGGRLMP